MGVSCRLSPEAGHHFSGCPDAGFIGAVHRDEVMGVGRFAGEKHPVGDRLRQLRDIVGGAADLPKGIATARHGSCSQPLRR